MKEIKENQLIKYKKLSVTDSNKLFNKIDKINIDYSQENFILFCLNGNNIILNKILFKGGITACLIDPRIIFREALINNCSKIIIAHNHPSNNLNPSIEDLNIFEELKKIGLILDIEVLDFIVFNKKEFYSIADNNKLSKDMI